MKLLKSLKRITSIMLVMLMLVFFAAGCKEETGGKNNQESTKRQEESTLKQPESTIQNSTQQESTKQNSTQQEKKLDKNGSYTSKEDVSEYLIQYGKLPDNFITKTEARKLGWEGGSLEKFAKGKCIGGDKYGNYEGLLPKGEQYYECDIDTLGASSRGAKRLVYTKSGSIYYTDDHYETFKKLN